jgi:hypothetical protein
MPIFEKQGVILVGLRDDGGFFGTLGDSGSAGSGSYPVDEWKYVAVAVCLESELTRLDYYVGNAL